MSPMAESHPLAQIRDILGLTQPGLGRLIGLAGKTVKKIEGKARPLTGENVRIISAATGVSSYWLLSACKRFHNPASSDIAPPGLEDFHGEPVNFMGKPFTREWYHQWIAQNSSGNPEIGIPTNISEREIIDVETLIKKLKSTSRGDLFSQHLQRLLSPGMAMRIANDDGRGSAELKPALANDLTRILSAADLRAANILDHIRLTPETQAFLNSPQKRSGASRARLNRLIIEDAYPNIIKRHSSSIDKAVEEIEEFVRLVCTAATRTLPARLSPVHKAIIQAIYEIRNSFNLNDCYWQEWESTHISRSPSGMKLVNPSLLWMWDPDAHSRMGLKSFFNPSAAPGNKQAPAKKSIQAQALKKKKPSNKRTANR